MTRGLTASLVLAMLLSGCVDNPGADQAAAPDPAEAAPPAIPLPVPELPGAPGNTGPAETPPTAPVVDAPHIYMAIEPDGTGTVSVIFAIDQSRDNTPRNDPAIRLTPEDGKCNPQQMSSFNFNKKERARPVYGPEEAGGGITARDLPNFMAIAVTSEMMRTGLVVEPPESKPQNVCTRKLWERLIVNQSISTTGQG